MTENLELEDLRGAEIIGYSWHCGRIRELQIKLKDGTLLSIKANGSVSDKRFRVERWLEVWTWRIYYDCRKKLL